MAIPDKSLGQLFLEKCIEFLENEGYRPKLDGESIDFKKEGTRYSIDSHGQLIMGFAIRTYVFYEASHLDRTVALELANDGNSDFIDVKAVVMKNYVSGDKDYTVILFKSETHYFDDFDLVFDDKIDAIQKGVEQFDQRLWERQERLKPEC